MSDLSIYIHIPFCVRKCLYCDFLSYPVSGGQSDTGCGSVSDAYVREKIISYVNMLQREIMVSAAKYKGYRVISVFWGGGTPSLLPTGEVDRIMSVLKENYRIAADAEITIEMNPESVTAEKLQEYITCGINRVSIGLQSTDDAELARIGRVHDYGTFLKAYELARRAGFRNINIDLMAALPGQSLSSYERTLKRVTELAPEHISAYSLILEEGTLLYERQGEYRFPTEEEDREMYALTGDYLTSCGYHRYEISNYARPDRECRHNIVYWQRGNYVGFGPGASSMVGNVRWTNPADMEQYRDYAVRLPDGAGTAVEDRKCGQVADIYPSRQMLTLREQMEEYMFLGLRMMCGVSVQRFADEFGQRIDTVYGAVLDKLYGQGLLTREEDRIRLTTRGIDLSNYAMAQFLFD